MKDFCKHPFVKFLMVLAGIVAVALTVWVVFEVIDEIRDDKFDKIEDMRYSRDY